MNADIAAAFGCNLPLVRRHVGLSQDELASLASLHRTEIGLLGHGKRLARADTLVKLGAGLGVDPGVLLDGITWCVAGKLPGGFDVQGPGERIRDVGR